MIQTIFFWPLPWVGSICRDPWIPLTGRGSASWLCLSSSPHVVAGPWNLSTLSTLLFGPLELGLGTGCSSKQLRARHRYVH